MADTKAQLQAEEWVREEFLNRKFNRHFFKGKVPLTWGGQFEFDAVSDDGKIIACISTAKAKTSNGKPGVGKCNKIMADTMYLLHAEGALRRILVFTETDILGEFEKKKKAGRFPGNIELILADELPSGIRQSLESSRGDASKEVGG